MRVFLKKVSFNVAEHLILIISHSKRQNLHWKASYDWLQNENARLTFLEIVDISRPW